MRKASWVRLLGVGIVAMLLALPGVVRAGPIYNNFGAGDSYNTTTTWPLGNDFVGDNQAQAETFTPSTSALLGDIKMALSYVTGPTNSVNIALETSSGGMPSGTVLESWTATGLGPQGSNNPLVTLNSTLHPALVAGTAYWIVASATDPNSSLGWNFNSTGATGNHATSLDGGATWGITPLATQGAFRVDPQVTLSTTPEPGSLTLLSLCGLGLIGYRLRRRA